MGDQKVNIRYILVVILAVGFTWIIHEFTHWLTSELLGYETIMRLNGTSPVQGIIHNDVHKQIISISAPVITVLQGLLVFLYLKSGGWSKYIYTFLFMAFWMRLLAGFMNFIMPNDEARVGQFLGIGTHTLSIIVSVFLFYLVFRISRQYELSKKFQLLTLLIAFIASWTLILSDQFFRIRIL